MNVLKGIKWIVYSNLWVAINVVAFYLFVVLILDLSIDFRYASLLFLSTIFAYNYQRLLKNESSSVSDHHSERHFWIAENQQLIKVLTFIGAIGTIVLAIWVLPIKLMLMSVPALIIVMLYARKSDSLSALRNVPFLKILLISVVWVFVVLIVPLLMMKVEIGKEILNLSIQMLLFVVVMCIPFDIRDQKIDAGNIKTLPVVLGVKKSKSIAIVLMLLVGVWGVLCEMYSFALVTIFVVPSLVYTSQDRRELFFTGWIEGQFLLLLLLQLFIEVI